jgi:restriction system protein
MARRRERQGVADDLFAIALKLPWWASAGIALLSYFVLHAYASTVIEPATGTADISRTVTHGFARALAGFGQYILPLIFTVGAAVAFMKQRNTVKLIDDVAASESPDALAGMSWREFERLVGEWFRRQGYRVTQVGGDGPDGGVDLMLTRGTEKTLVQCKQWRAHRVGVNVVRELYGVMAAQGAAAGVVVTSGTFTPDAIEFASGRNVRLVGGPELHKMISSEESGSPAVNRPASVRTESTVGAPRCPKCGNGMVRREAKRGVNAGKSFWGCSKFPSCRGTVAID